MVRISPILFGLPLATAWPAVMQMVGNEALNKRGPEAGRPNTALPPDGFSEDQFVDVSPDGPNPWIRPSASDKRGQCPGLNAAANHGFLPRSGLLTSQDTINGLTAAYNMAASQALLLSVLAIALSGDFVTDTWSIGQSFPATGLGLLGTPQGLLGTHNSYEGDASVVSGDAYLNNGDVGVFQQDKWAALMAIGDDGYGFDNLAQHNLQVINQSISTNPYYFAGPLSGAIVTPGAHNFMVVFMSNHTAENPGGYLTREHLMTFFGVSGDTEGEYVFDYGAQQIPQNWYKMPFGNSYTLVQTAADALLNGVLYPGITRIGGNTGEVNTYTGLDLIDFTDGLYSLDNLAEGNNALCFALQATMFTMASEVDVLGFLTKALAPTIADLGCPDLTGSNFDMSALEQFPGYSYRPSGQSKRLKRIF